ALLGKVWRAGSTMMDDASGPKPEPQAAAPAETPPRHGVGDAMKAFGAFLKRAIRRRRYEVDLSSAPGPVSLVRWPGLAPLVVVVIAGVFIHVSKVAPDGSQGLTVFEAMWEAAMRTIDAGNVGGDTGWDFRLVMLVVTIWGIFVVSSLIGLLSAGVQT